MERHVLVIGSDIEGENIGSAIEAEINSSAWRATGMPINGYQDLPDMQVLKIFSDLVITCGATVMKPFMVQTDHEISKVLDACLYTPMVACRRFVAARMSSVYTPPERFKIILLGSYAHDHVLSDSAPYCAAKAGLHHFAKCLAWETTAHGFDTIVVHPHSVQHTPMTDRVMDALQANKGIGPTEAAEYWCKDLKLHYRLTKSEIARLVASLILDETSPHMSGAAIELYGGSR